MTSGYRMGLHKPAELFRADLISAMKLPDSVPMETGSFLTIRDPWRTEWEVGVQVCVSPNQMPEAKARTIDDPPVNSEAFRMPPTWYTEENTDPQYVQYDLDDLDLNWLESVNQKRKFRALAGPGGLSEDTLREAILVLETKCQENMAKAVTTEESLGIEYDEQTVCDICGDCESEESNDMIFCDSCNVCVHQVCYGVSTIPRGEWLCKVCVAGERETRCVLCPNKGGALKRVRPWNTGWAHLNCALWIPEVRVGNVEKMEPITNIDAVPASRWNLVCCVCRKKHGACIQCSYPSCVAAFHVTCGFRNGLGMKSRLDVVNNGVIHESYCLKHTVLRSSPSKQSSPHKNDMSIPTQLVQVQEAFHKYASPEDLTRKLKLSPKLSTLLYNYWKLKRKSLHNRPLLSHLPIENSIESLKAELALGSQFGFSEYFMRIIHLRQNLEKARNLVYMVQKRERIKKQLLQSEAELFELESRLLEEEVGEEEEEEEEEEEVFSAPPSPAQTRSMAQKLELAEAAAVTPATTCNHVGHPTMNGPTSNCTPDSDNSAEISPVVYSSYRSLRSREIMSPSRQLAFLPDESQLVRPKMRRRFSDSDMASDSQLNNGTVDGLVIKAGPPALNLRHRPYTINRT